MLLARAPEMQRGPAGTVTLRGVVRTPGGRPSTLLLRMTPLDAQASPRAAQPAIATDASGRFTIAAVPPGRYRIAARRSTAPGDLIAPFAAVIDIIVGGSDRDDLVLDLKPGGLIEGRVLVDGGFRGWHCRVRCSSEARCSPLWTFLPRRGLASIARDGSRCRS